MFIVTGGGTGIGQALAWRLAELDHSVLICGRTADTLSVTQSRFPDNIAVIVGDLTQPDTIGEIQDKLEAKPITGLVQNAAQLTPIAPLSEVSLEAFRAQQNTNVDAPLALFQALKPQLSGGRVLHLSSAAAHYPFASWGAYCISKASLFMMYQILKTECPDINFGSVMPGVTDTAMQAQIRDAVDMPTGDRVYFKDLHQSQRLLAPSVVAQFLGWLLLSAKVSEFSGQEWDIYDQSHHHHWLESGQVPEI